MEQEKMPEPGRMKIFFGYAAGVGKTYAMLEAAHQAKDAGTDVVLACAEPEPWPETAAFRQQFACLPAGGAV